MIRAQVENLLRSLGFIPDTTGLPVARGEDGGAFHDVPLMHQPPSSISPEEIARMEQDFSDDQHERLKRQALYEMDCE